MTDQSLANLARLMTESGELAAENATLRAHVAELEDWRRIGRDAADKLSTEFNRVRELEAELAATTRELERWRHGETVAEDFVCPDTLRVTELEAELLIARRALQLATLPESPCCVSDCTWPRSYCTVHAIEIHSGACDI